MFYKRFGVYFSLPICKSKWEASIDRYLLAFKREQECTDREGVVLTLKRVGGGGGEEGGGQ